MVDPGVLGKVHHLYIDCWLTRPGEPTNFAMERSTMLFMGKSTISTGPFSIAKNVSSPEGKSSIFLWFSYGFPMVFLWFSYGFPMVFPLIAGLILTYLNHPTYTKSELNLKETSEVIPTVFFWGGWAGLRFPVLKSEIFDEFPGNGYGFLWINIAVFSMAFLALNIHRNHQHPSFSCNFDAISIFTQGTSGKNRRCPCW